MGNAGEKRLLTLNLNTIGQSTQRRRTKQDLIMDVSSDVKYNERLFVEHRKISAKAIWGEIIVSGLNSSEKASRNKCSKSQALKYDTGADGQKLKGEGSYHSLRTNYGPSCTKSVWLYSFHNWEIWDGRDLQRFSSKFPRNKPLLSGIVWIKFRSV